MVSRGSSQFLLSAARVRTLNRVGRFDRKYPREAIEALFHAAIDERRTVQGACDRVAETHGVEIRYETARQYVKVERTRRLANLTTELADVDPAQAIDALAGRLIVVLELEVRQIERKANDKARPDPLDLGRIDKIADSLAKLRKATVAAYKPAPTKPKPNKSGGNNNQAIRALTQALESRAPAHTREGAGNGAGVADPPIQGP